MKRSLHADSAPRRWLLLVHQLPSEPSHLRVRAWRRMRELGAVSIKQAVYVLPDSTRARDEFHRVSQDIHSIGGDASVFVAESLEGRSDESLVTTFHEAQRRAYRALERDIQQALRRGHDRQSRTPMRMPGAPQRLLRFRERLAAIERRDFFAAPGRDRVLALLDQLANRLSTSERRSDRAPEVNRAAAKYRGAVWVTRPRPGVDRMASAWLIRRFLDRDARFDFATDRHVVPADAIPFDMTEVEFSHHAGQCTFETLCTRFGIRDRAVDRIAAIVHDLDLKDDRFGAPEAATVGTLVQGLQLAQADDALLLEQGMAVFEALYRAPARRPAPASSQLAARTTP